MSNKTTTTEKVDMDKHLQRAKDYIAKGDDYYAKAADEIIAWLAEDPQRSQQQAAECLGHSQQWVSKLVQARTNYSRAGRAFEVDWQSGSNKRDEVTKTTLAKADPNAIRNIVRELPREQREHLIDAAHDATMDEIHATSAEHDLQPTAGDLMPGDRFDPSESWADTLIMRVNKNARELGAHVQKWGLVISALGEDTAFEYLQEAERHVADVRAALQERIYDRTEA